jgi:branched-chain amino acid transport system substrate-binding protein
MKGYVILPALLIAVILAGCTPPPLKVAVLASLGGAKEGAQLAADEWNARGGVLSKQIVLVVKSTNVSDPYSAIQAAQDVITKDHVRYIVGDIFSTLSIGISEVANTAKVIEITPASTNAAVTVDMSGTTKAYVFRACFDDAAQGRLGAFFVTKKLKARKAFIMVDRTNAYISGLAEAFSTSFTNLGGAIVGTETYSYGDTDFSRTLAKITQARPDVVYLPALSPPVVNMAIQQARKKGITTPFMGGDGWDDAALDPQAADGSYFTTHFRPDDPRPEVQTFVKAYRAKYDDAPNDMAALSYDAMNLLLTGIRAAGADNADAVRIVLEKIAFDAVTGKITMGSRHTPVKGAVVLHVTEGKVTFDSYVSP